MNGFDLALAVVTGVFAILGLVKGLSRLLIGTAALGAAFLLATRFHRELAERLTWIDLSGDARKLIAYLAICLGTLLVGGLVGWLASRLLRAAMLGWADRLAGGAIGLLAAALFAALVVLPLVAYSPRGERALRDSVLAPYVAVVADLAKLLAPRELAEKYDEKVEGLRRYWREIQPTAPQVEDRAGRSRRA